MIFNIDDIEIFITTHNRADYLVSAIKSILNQTAKVKTITVLDNESTDNTEEVVKQFESQGVKYIKTFGFLGNFNKAKEIASQKYIMLFHDDDILHPEYLELALKVLNKYENISLITTRYTEFEGDNVPEFVDFLNESHYFFKKQKDFAAHMYFVERIAYASAIYRTVDFKNTPLEYEKYSKFNDWPFMLKISALGNSIVLDDSNVYFVRRHINQDTWTSTNTPSLQQIINWDKCFYDVMNLKYNFFSKLNLCFNVKCKYFMEGKYNSFLSNENKKEFPLEFLWQKARDEKLNPVLIKNNFLNKILYGFYKDIEKKYKSNSLQIEK